MFVQRRLTDDADVHGLGGVPGQLYANVRRRLDRLPLKRYPNRDRTPFSPAWLPERRAGRIREFDPDVVHLHWVTGGFLHPATLKDIRAPIVWTCHDMWPFTGGCHYAKSCEKYERRCGSCPRLASDTERDLSRRTWDRKSAAFEDVEITVVAPSRWMAECASNSSLLEGSTVEVIPNGLDTERFRPREPDRVRSKFGVDEEASLVVFGADSAVPRKGHDLLVEALGELEAPDDVHVVGFGSEDPLDVEGVATTSLGYLSESDLLGLYSDADAVVVPSRQESFGQLASEALSSGTPVVAFDATGVRDIVDHEATGYLAEPFDPDDLARGIEWVLADGDRWRRLSERARSVAEERYSLRTVARRHRKLYEQVLSE